MSILVFGRTGQVAAALQDQAKVIALGRGQADLADPDACVGAIRAHAPRAVINAAAYTAVDKAETESDLAHTVNGTAPTVMAETCKALGIPFVHISTDYVFDGTGDAPFSPGDPTSPLGAYGASKLAGEQGIERAGGAFAVLRTSWVVSASGNNFAKTMLRRGAERDMLNIVADQIGGPTPAEAVAEACLTIAAHLDDAPEKRGIYHFAGTPDVSWADFARTIFKEADLDCTVTDIPSSEYPTPAQRPLNSRLDCSLTEKTFGLARPDWRAALGPMIAQIRSAT